MNINKDVKFITLTNDGYIDYTLNCLKSLDLINSEYKLNCFCIGNECYNKLKDNKYNSTLLDYEKIEDTELNNYRKGNWHNVTKRKFDIIYNELKNNDFVCITDGDIIFLNKNFMSFCLDYIQDNDFIIQNDSLSDSDNENLCSGFMFIRSNKNTIELFNPENVKKYVKSGWGDQKYINIIKNKLKYKKLPLDLFPNGQYFYNNHEKLNPYLVHFNWIRLQKWKKRKMKKHKMWYL